MPGPTPKPAAKRRRRNVSTTARTLRPVTGTPSIPELPPRRINGKSARWSKPTLDWWERVWASPMAPEFDPSDVDGLFVLAVLVDTFWKDPSPEHAKELRLHRQCFGLEPIARRRLQWEIDRGEGAAERTRERRAPKGVGAAGRVDPRADAG